MTSSRSTASKSSGLAIAILCALCALASAGGRKRVVVLDFEGPKAEKFHDDIVKLIKGKHTIIPTEKWSSTADDLGATGSSERDLKKVAKKLKIDAIITGKIDKRRDEYLITLKVRGADGAIINNLSTKSGQGHVDGGATRDLNGELMPAIDEIGKAGGGGGGDDDEDKPAKKPDKKKKPAADDDEEAEAKPAKKPVATKKKPAAADDDEDSDVKPAAKKGFGGKKMAAASSDDDEDKPKKPVATKKKPAAASDDDEDKPAPKKKVADDEDKPAAKKKEKDKPADDDEDKPAAKKKEKDKPADDDEDKPKKKKVAATDDEGNPIDKPEEGGDDEEADSPLSPTNRALDLRVGLSFMARRLSFTYQADLGSNAPPGYKGVPAPGFLLDGTFFPGAMSHKGTGIAKDLGVRLVFDKALLLSSQVTPPGGMATKLSTSMTHYEIGGAFRHGFGALTFEASLSYGGQSFAIAPSAGVTAAQIDVPDVVYHMFIPSVGIKYAASPKITLDVTAGLQVITSEGAMGSMTNYGDASVLGFAGEVGGDYLVTKNIFVRAAFRFATIGYSFKGTGAMTTGRDADAEQDVFGARDTYIGGAVTAGYLY